MDYLTPQHIIFKFNQRIELNVTISTAQPTQSN